MRTIQFDCSRAGAVQRFQRFHHSVEAQFGDLSPKATHHQEIKNLTTGILYVDEYVLQFKAEASQTDLGDTGLVEY